MIEYVNEAGEVTMGTNFGEAYDKEWALQDEAFRDGKKEGLVQCIEQGIEEGTRKTTMKLAQRMLEKGIFLDDISDITGLSSEEIENINK